MRDAGLPRHHLNRAEVGKGEHVGQPGLESALDIDDVPHRRGPVDGPAEGHAVFDRTREPVDQHVAAAFGADQVRIADANDVDVLRHELGSRSPPDRWCRNEPPEPPRLISEVPLLPARVRILVVWGRTVSRLSSV